MRTMPCMRTSEQEVASLAPEETLRDWMRELDEIRDLPETAPRHDD